MIKSSARASPIFPLETWIKLGIGPRRSSSVCILTAALVERKSAHGNSERHKSIVVLSSAYTVLTSAHSTVKCNGRIFGDGENLARGLVAEYLSGARVKFVLDPLDIGMRQNREV